MRNLILIVLLAFIGQESPAQIKGNTQQYLTAINVLKNAGYENRKSNWTATGSTFTLSSTTPYAGFAKAIWNPTATSEFFKSATQAMPVGLYGKSCLARIHYLSDSLVAGDVTVKVTDGTSDLTTALDLAPTTGTYVTVDMGFICPTSGGLAIEFNSTANAAAVDIDQNYLGDDFRIGTTGVEVGPATSQAITGVEWTNDAALVPVGNLTGQRIGNSLHLTYGGRFTGAVGTDVADLTFNIPSTWGTLTIPASNVGSAALRVAAAAAADSYPNFDFSMRGTGGQALIITASPTSTNGQDGSDFGTNVGKFQQVSFDIMLSPTEWANQGITQTVTPETQNPFLNAHYGSDCSWGVTTSTSFADPVAGDASCTLTVNDSSGVTNVVRTSDDMPAIEADLPFLGDWFVCASIPMGQATSLVYGATALLVNGTVVSERSQRPAATSGGSMTHCSQFTPTALASNEFRFQGKVTSGTWDFNIASGAVAKAVSWNIFSLSGGNSTVAITPATATTAGGVTFSESVCDGSQNMCSGNYLPVTADRVNVSGNTEYTLSYLVVGKTVTVAGRIDAVSTAAAASFTISLPTGFPHSTVVHSLGGAGHVSAGALSGSFIAHATTTKAQFNWVATTIGSTSVVFNFSYRTD